MLLVRILPTVLHHGHDKHSASTGKCVEDTTLRDPCLFWQEVSTYFGAELLVSHVSSCFPLPLKKLWKINNFEFLFGPTTAPTGSIHSNWKNE